VARFRVPERPRRGRRARGRRQFWRGRGWPILLCQRSCSGTPSTSAPCVTRRSCSGTPSTSAPRVTCRSCSGTPSTSAPRVTRRSCSGTPSTSAPRVTCRSCSGTPSTSAAPQSRTPARPRPLGTLRLALQLVATTGLIEAARCNRVGALQQSRRVATGSALRALQGPSEPDARALHGQCSSTLGVLDGYRTGTREGILGVSTRAGTHWYYAPEYSSGYSLVLRTHLHHLEQLRRWAVVAPLRQALHREYSQ
jgi:hypothetical protein